MSYTISQFDQFSDQQISQINALLSQLSTSAKPITQGEAFGIANADNTVLFFAFQGNKDIVGMLTLVMYTTPTGKRARIEDVVVDISARGEGLGKALTLKAIERAKEYGAKSVDLTSSPARGVANLLYQKMGFELRETNVYRLKINKEN